MFPKKNGIVFNLSMETPSQNDTLPKHLRKNFLQKPGREAMRVKDRGIWQSFTWKDCYEKVKFLSMGLLSLGLEKEDKVSILGGISRSGIGLSLQHKPLEAPPLAFLLIVFPLKSSFTWNILNQNSSLPTTKNKWIRSSRSKINFLFLKKQFIGNRRDSGTIGIPS